MSYLSKQCFTPPWPHCGPVRSKLSMCIDQPNFPNPLLPNLTCPLSSLQWVQMVQNVPDLRKQYGFALSSQLNTSLPNHKPLPIITKPPVFLVTKNVTWSLSLTAQCDRMAAECATDLRKHSIAFISLWPGPVKNWTTRDSCFTNWFRSWQWPSNPTGKHFSSFFFPF